MIDSPGVLKIGAAKIRFLSRGAGSDKVFF